MSYLGSWKIDDALTFAVNILDPATNQAAAADSAPAYRIYEDETATAILTGSMAALDSGNTTGFYTEQITLSAANGFEKGKCYTIYIEADVSSNTITRLHTFQLNAPVDVTHISDDATAADNLEAMLDGTRAKLYLSQLDIQASGNDNAITAMGAGTGEGIYAAGGSGGGNGMQLNGGGSNAGLSITGGAAGVIVAGTAGNGVAISGTTNGISSTGGGSGAGIKATGGSSNGSGLEIAGGTGGKGATIDGNGSGVGLEINAGANDDTHGMIITSSGGDGIGLSILGSNAGLYALGASGDGFRALGTTNDINADITGNLSGSVGSLATQAKNDVGDAVWDEASADHNSVGTMGLLQNETPDQDYLETLIDGISTLIGTPVNVDGSAATLAGMIIKIIDDNGGADFDASTDSLNAIMQEVIPELTSGEPPSQPTWKQALMLLYMALRNNNQLTKDPDTRLIVNNAGTTICKATTVTSTSSFSQGKLTTP